MRSFLGFVVLVVVLVGLLVLVVVPLVGRPLVASLVRDALPFDAQAVDVSVDIGPSMLSGAVETVAIDGRDLQSADISIGAVHLTIEGFGIFDRTFRSVEGRLEDVQVRLEDGTPVSIARIDLSGPSETVLATAILDATATEGLIRAKLTAAGIAHERVRLADSAVEVSAAGQTVRSTVEARDDGLFLVADRPLPPLALIELDGSDAWRFTAVVVSPAGVVIEATVAAEALLAG